MQISTTKLTQAQATLLMPLWSRAIESSKSSPILKDAKAAEIVNSLDFPFEQFITKKVPQSDYCVRAAVMDQLVQEFLDEHPSGRIIEFGVGLDTRFDRLDNGLVNWFEIDFPDVIAVRKEFFDESPRREMIACSITSNDWLERFDSQSTQPTLFVAEGVLYFLERSEVDVLLEKLKTNFANSSFVFDCQSPWYLWFSNLRQPVPDAKLRFSVSNPVRDFSLHKGVHVKRWVGFGDQPYYRDYLERLGLVKHWGRRLLPPVRAMFKIIELRW